MLLCFRRPLLVYFLLFSLLSCCHRCFWVDREVGGVPPLPFNSCQPIMKQHPPPPGRCERAPFSKSNQQGSARAQSKPEGMRDESPVGPPCWTTRQTSSRGDGGGGDGEGGNPTLDSWKLNELQTTFSHKVKILEDVTHSQSWLKDEEEEGGGGGGGVRVFGDRKLDAA